MQLLINFSSTNDVQLTWYGLVLHGLDGFFWSFSEDLLAWQRPVPFCCASAYSLDERQERMARTLLELLG